MPHALERHYDTCSSHFITCSCYRRKPLLADDRIKQVFLTVLEETRIRYRFCVYGYVLMPKHFHLIIGRPEFGDTGKALQVLKQRVSHVARKILGPTLSHTMGKDGAPSDVARSDPSEWEVVDPTLSQKTGKDGAPTSLMETRPTDSWQFWQRRFYDFNVWNRAKLIEKLKYMHRNPVARELVARPEDWPWSSFRQYAGGEIGPVEIESEWTAVRRERVVRVMQVPSA